MLKKAGIVTAATMAALLSISPLAFAGGHGSEYHGDSDYHHSDTYDHHDGSGDDGADDDGSGDDAGAAGGNGNVGSDNTGDGNVGSNNSRDNTVGSNDRGIQNAEGAPDVIPTGTLPGDGTNVGPDNTGSNNVGSDNSGDDNVGSDNGAGDAGSGGPGAGGPGAGGPGAGGPGGDGADTGNAGDGDDAGAPGDDAGPADDDEGQGGDDAGPGDDSDDSDAPSGSGGANSVDHTSMGLVNGSGNNVNGTANGGCNNDVAGAGGVAAQKGVPVQAIFGVLAPASSTNTVGTQDGRDCSVGETGAGHSAGDAAGEGAEGAGDGANSVDHTSMGLVNGSDNNLNGTANALCNNDVTGALGAAAQKDVPVQAVGGAAAPVTSTNTLGTQDGRSCGIDSTSAGDSAGDN